MFIHPYQGILPTIDATAYIHPNAVVIGDVHIGAYSSIWPGVVMRADVNRIRVGARTNIQDGSILHVTRATPDNPGGIPLIIGDDVTIGHRVSLHACHLKDGSIVGIGAILLDRVILEAHAMVGAGSLVTPGTRIPPGELWMGSPARSIRPLRPDELRHHAETAVNYQRLAEAYRTQHPRP